MVIGQGDSMEKIVKELEKDLNFKVIKNEKDKSYSVQINDDLNVVIYNYEPKLIFHAVIDPLPEAKKEDLIIYLMKANFLYQGTDGSKIGVDEEEKNLTLTRALSYEVKYDEFKESLEDFVNFVIYYRNEIENHKKQIEQNIIK